VNQPKKPPRHAEAVADPKWDGVRLDAFVSEGLGLFSRSQAKQRIVEATVNGKPARLAKKLKAGDLVAVDYREAVPVDVLPEDIALEVLFENSDVIVMDKPQGMVVHPEAATRRGHWSTRSSSTARGWPRASARKSLGPCIVHRLDKETSGVIIAAKNPRAHEALFLPIQSRKARKLYLAILSGSPRRIAGGSRLDS